MPQECNVTTSVQFVTDGVVREVKAMLEQWCVMELNTMLFAGDTVLTAENKKEELVRL